MPRVLAVGERIAIRSCAALKHVLGWNGESREIRGDYP